MIRKILIANRGEIAVRVTRTAQAMGIRTVAVYSEADARSNHVALADEAVLLGGSAPSESYLRIDKILDACHLTGADAVHPGYGFLSENAEFSEALSNAGITFIGPPATAMRKLGAKIDAKKLAVELGVPITPGYFEPGASNERLLEEARKIGFPVMLKASAGGGGRGMRIVRNEAEFLSEAAIASDEALKGFGDGAMMVEKLVEDPRHIETQFIADQHGNVVVLFERECSIQRRHQKLIEEAPSPLSIDESTTLWPRMREATRSLALGANYVGAGTAEFMVDRIDGEFFFLEVNARLQVEHPVTEAITGLDLVRLQIQVAQGDALDLPADLMEGKRSAMNGWAIEARIVAEDPAQGFLPSVGKLIGWAEPKGPGIRVDTGYGPGAEVSRFYDSLVAKVISHGANRAEAIARLRAALLDFHILGVKTNIAYLLEVLDHSDFHDGAIDTGFLAREFGEWSPGNEVPTEIGSILASSLSVGAETSQAGTPGTWQNSDGFRSARRG